MTDATRTAPVSKHPAFKWGVGLWFALLMGLGLFVMPESIHQALAERLFLDGVLSAGSSRIVLSIIAALLGLLIGVVLAMRVAALNDAVHDDDEEDDVDPAWLRDEEEQLPVAATEDAPRRPFNPREDMHEEGIATFKADYGAANETFLMIFSGGNVITASQVLTLTMHADSELNAEGTEVIENATAGLNDMVRSTVPTDADQTIILTASAADTTILPGSYIYGITENATDVVNLKACIRTSGGTIAVTYGS